MWILFWKKYTLSKFATFISIVGMLTRYAGVSFLFAEIIPAGLICIAVGIGLHFGAEAIAKRKANIITSGTNNSSATKTEPTTVNANTTSQSVPKSVQTNASPTANTNSTTEADEKIRCSQCGTYVSATSKFCTECGKTMKKTEPKQKKCLRCGATVDGNSKFCGQCGYQSK